MASKSSTAPVFGVHPNFFELDTVKEEGDWEYYSIVTNIDLSRTSLQEVFEHHKKRGNCENFIREGKYNFNLKDNVRKRASPRWNHPQKDLMLV